MDDLNPKARALVDVGRSAFRPGADDRARVEAALRARLGADVLPPARSLTRHVSAPVKRGAARLALGAGAVVVVGATFFALRPGAQPASETTAHSSQLRAAAPDAPATHDASDPGADGPASTRAAASPGQTPAPVASVPSVAAPSSSHAPNRLAQEVALLSRATAALQAGHPAKALRALDEHQRKFPSGALSEERRTAKAQALCLVGRLTSGRAELALLSPQSPAAARAQQVCEAGALTIPAR